MTGQQGWADFDSYIGMARRAVNAELRVQNLEAELVKYKIIGNYPVDHRDNCVLCDADYSHTGCISYRENEERLKDDRIAKLETELAKFVECDEPSSCYIAGSKGSDMCIIYHKVGE